MGMKQEIGKVSHKVYISHCTAITTVAVFSFSSIYFILVLAVLLQGPTIISKIFF